jgi:lysozyme family protein
MPSTYQTLYDSAIVNSSKMPMVDGIISKIVANMDRYKSVVKSFSGMPYWFVSVIHHMEASLSFKHHLHNGDPLTERTTHVPKGRPKAGNPPFLWEDSCIDALKISRLRRYQ